MHSIMSLAALPGRPTVRSDWSNSLNARSSSKLVPPLKHSGRWGRGVIIQRQCAKPVRPNCCLPCGTHADQDTVGGAGSRGGRPATLYSRAVSVGLYSGSSTAVAEGKCTHPTKAGHLCTRDANPGSNYCTQHGKMAVRRDSSSGGAGVAQDPAQLALFLAAVADRFKELLNPKDLAALIHELIHYKMRSNDSPGSIYAFFDPQGHEDEYKVGATRHPTERLTAWQRKCRRGFTLEGEPVPVAWIYLAEFMISKVLKFRGKWLEQPQCPCGVKHREWYGVTWRELRPIIAFWTELVNKHQALFHLE